MDKTTTERETRDFMNVDSFSQLPFIRPAPPIREKSGIRLFGIEFAGGDDSASVSVDDSDSGETTKKNNQNDNNNNNNNLTAFDPVKGDDTITTTTTTTATETNSESSRRFECHYCCRNFPTSQALGGHQNAHKRERQHAKRAHLQSTMVHGSTFSDAHHHVYNLMNYRFGSTPSTPPMPYPSWNNNTRFYGTTTMSFSDHNHYHNQHHQQQQPINGSPLAFWRTPNSNPSFSHERSTTLPPLFASEEITANMRTSQVVGASNSQKREHVSLDLHL